MQAALKPLGFQIYVTRCGVRTPIGVATHRGDWSSLGKISELNDTNETISNFVAEFAPPRAPAGSKEARKPTVAAGVMRAASTSLLQVERQ